MKKVLMASLLVFGLIGGVFLLGKIGSSFSNKSFSKSTSFKPANFFADSQVALITIEGGIFDSEKILEELEEAKEDRDVEAVVLRLNSPGGAVGPSQEILEGVLSLDEVKPVVASMSTVAASGAYYVALGARKIIANPGTLTGSIGVRMEHVELSELFSWAKVNYQTIKSGKFKDIGAIDRPMKDEERVILEGLLGDIHDQFKEAVVEYRGLDRSTVDEIADGRVYSGRQAKQLALIDELGGLDKAVKLAGELAGIKGKAKLIRKKSKNLLYFEKYLDSLLDIGLQKLRSKISMNKLALFAY